MTPPAQGYWCPFCREDRRFDTPKEHAEHVLLNHSDMLNDAGLRQFQKLCNGWDAVLQYAEEMRSIHESEVSVVNWQEGYEEAQKGFYRGYFTALDDLVHYLTGKEPVKKWEVK